MNKVEVCDSLSSACRVPTSASDLLRARAKELAREKVSVAAAAGDDLQVIDFDLSGEAYAFDLTFVREVGALTELTPLPSVPDYILGVTWVHGQIIAVVDLRKIFALPERGLRDSRQVIVLHSADMEFGILADRVAGVRRLALAALQPSMPTLTKARAAYLEGIAPDGTIVLSAAKLLADPKLTVNHSNQ